MNIKLLVTTVISVIGSVAISVIAIEYSTKDDANEAYDRLIHERSPDHIDRYVLKLY